MLAKKLAKREREKRVMLRCSDPIPISMISRMAGCYAQFVRAVQCVGVAWRGAVQQGSEGKCGRDLAVWGAV